MTDRKFTDEEQALREQLHMLADDVEPRPDALPRILAAARRRRAVPRRPLAVVATAAAAMAAVFLGANLIPQQNTPEPVSVQPNSYLAVLRPGVIASFDVLSGQQNGEFGRIPNSLPHPLTASGGRIYVTAPAPEGTQIIEVLRGGQQRALYRSDSASPKLSAAGGRLAITDRDAVVVLENSGQRRIPTPSDAPVWDVALAADGTLAVLGGSTPRPDIWILPPGANSFGQATELDVPSGCGALAITWSGQRLAALQPVDCASGQYRVAVFDPKSGRQLSSGAPFHAGLLNTEQVQLSVDQLGRYLVSTGRQQWLVDGAKIRPVPRACGENGACANAPGTFWE